MIRVLSLINGEKIIGEVEDDFSEYYNVVHPFDLEQVDDAVYGSGLKINYLLQHSQKNCITIKNNMVLYSYIPNENMRTYYEKLVQYKVEYKPDDMIEKTINDMEAMDKKYRQLLTRRLIGDEDVN
jgi:hypothetical protein